MTGQDEEAFGPWLARQLRRADMSQAALADELRLTRAAVSAWITGRAEPREETKREIAQILGIDAASVFNRADVTTRRPLQWHHRPAHTDGGREYGNAAAFAFDADLSVLAREATQNSIDERLDPNKPVRVRFTLHELTGEHLAAFLEACHWGELTRHYTEAAKADQKVSRSLRAALDDLHDTGSLLLLRVDDYNAAGLTGPEYGDGRYAAVVRRQLDSHKPKGGRAGGSYGLGKAALWATSRFSLVLVNSTLSTPHEGHTESRVVGRVDLPWRQVDDAAYAGPAWFGESDTEPAHRGVSRSWWADDETVRDLHLDRAGADPGTSFLIVGAHDASGDATSLQGMHDKLVGSLADGFWAAMVGGRNGRPLLEANVRTLRNGVELIAEQRVDPHEHHPALSRALQAYLDDRTVPELTAADQVAAVEVPLVVPGLRGSGRKDGKGRDCPAVLLVTPAADNTANPNRVVLMRGNRMTISERRPRGLPLASIQFQAVLLAGYATGRDGEVVEAAERFLRASEPPEHDRWGRTEELTALYERGALTRISEFWTELDKAVRTLVGRRDTTHDDRGPAALRELLTLEGPSSAARRAAGPTVRNVIAHLDDTGAWHVRVDLRVPHSEDPQVLVPIAKFDVRSGGRPAVGWANLTASEGCRIDAGRLIIDPEGRSSGLQTATFTGVTDPATHPVRSSLARLVIDVQHPRGEQRQ